MKKTVITLNLIALTLTTFAQTNSVKLYQVNDPNGYVKVWSKPDGGYVMAQVPDVYVNVRAGAGTNYEVVGKVENGSYVYRNFNEQITKNWIPILYSDTKFYRGYIHKSRLVALSESDNSVQFIFPKKSTIDTEKRAQLQQRVEEIDTMPLKCDTLHYEPFEKYDPSESLEFVYFDKAGRFRKYFWKNSVSDGSSEYGGITAYYDEKGELVYIFDEGGDGCEGEGEEYWVYERRIVDFYIQLDCICCDNTGDLLTKKEINDRRPVIGSELTKTRVRDRLFTNFINAHILLTKVKSKNNYREGDWLFKF